MTKSELLAQLAEKVQTLESCVLYQDTDKTDKEINAMADRLAREINEINAKLELTKQEGEK